MLWVCIAAFFLETEEVLASHLQPDARLHSEIAERVAIAKRTPKAEHAAMTR